MGRRWAHPFKFKVALPVDDPDSESDSGSDWKRGSSDSATSKEVSSSSGDEEKAGKDAADSGSSGEDAASAGETESDVETKMQRNEERSGSVSSRDSDSDDSDLDETVRSRLIRLSKQKNLTHDVSSSDESSDDNGGEENSENESLRKGGAQLMGKMKRRESSSSERASASSDSDSDSEVDSDTDEDTGAGEQKDAVESVRYAAEDSDSDNDIELLKDEEVEGKKRFYFETDSDEDWEPQEEEEEDDEDDDEDEEEEEEEGKKTKATQVVNKFEDSDEEFQDELSDDEFKSKTKTKPSAAFHDGERTQAKSVLGNLTSRVPLIEQTAIYRGVTLSGPPLEFATTQSDEYARFSQDASEIFEDYEVLPKAQQSSLCHDERSPQESAFAQVPRPMLAVTAEAVRRSSRKRKRTTESESQDALEENPSAATMVNIARVGGQFGDHFVESLLTANGRALQGIDDGFDYDKRCW
ncbi:unnamed protein product [Phytophthora fragariaefolia]|uniref:Unnamed protein product n=1 Tax=Phytophthora fragariaefolia TaxID=1490495 RepID=A0A9W6TNK3_9STRA|nr:unnamed protein product [Phytophthora fragariaefolia]